MKVSSTFLKRVALSFVRAFLASLLVFIVGLASAPEFSFTRAAAVAALVAAVTAGIRAVQHVLETGSSFTGNISLQETTYSPSTPALEALQEAADAELRRSRTSTS